MLPWQAADDHTPTFGASVVLPFGLAGDIYYLQPDIDRLPDFDKLVPVARVYTNKLNVQPRDFTGGFPGISSRVEWFAIDYNGRFWVENPGKFKFSLLSDDGSRLYIDDRLEIDNDGRHAPVLIAGSVNLARGIHRIRVSYFQGPRYSVALVLSVAPPGEKWKLFNTDDLKPPSNTANWDTADRKALDELEKEPSRKPKKNSKELAAEDDALRRIKGDVLPRDFAFRSVVLQFPGVQSSTRETDFTIAYEVPLANLKPQIDNRAETRTWRFLLLAVIHDAAGKVVEEMKLDVPFAVPEGQAKSVAGRYFTYARNFHLSSGKYRITTGVADRASGKLAAETAEMESETAAAGVRMSSLVMVDHVQPGSVNEGSDPLVYQGQRLVPMLSRTLGPTEQRTIFFLAKADPSIPEKPRLEVEFLVDGALVVKASPAMPDGNEAGLIPMSFAAPARAGKCELRLTSVQGATHATQTIAYEVTDGK